jgi:hypothetical protein
MATDSGPPSTDEAEVPPVFIENLIREYELQAEARRKDTALKSASVTVAITFVGMVAGVFALFTPDGMLRRPSPNISSDYLEAIRKQEDRLNALELSLKKMTPIKANGQKASQSLAITEISTLTARVNNLSAAIMASPEKALAVPLLRRDIDAMAKRVEEVQTQGKADMDRLYEQQKWILGGIGAVLIAVAGGAITIILRSLPNSNRVSS